MFFCGADLNKWRYKSYKSYNHTLTMSHFLYRDKPKHLLITSNNIKLVIDPIYINYDNSFYDLNVKQKYRFTYTPRNLQQLHVCLSREIPCHCSHSVLSILLLSSLNSHPGLRLLLYCTLSSFYTGAFEEPNCYEHIKTNIVF